MGDRFGTNGSLYDLTRVMSMASSQSASSDTPLPGPGITVDGFVIGLSGNTILLYDSGGAVVSEFPATQAGLIAALAAATSGDIVLCPRQMAIACTIGVTIPAGVTLRGANLTFSDFSGTGVTLSAGSMLNDFVVQFDGTGYATARGILATSVSCSLVQGDAYAINATANVAIELSGSNDNDAANTTNVFGLASGGSSAIGIRLLDFVHAKTTYASARGASTSNVGISFAATSTANVGWLLDGWGLAIDTGSYGMQIEAGKYGKIIGGFAVGVTAGLLISAAATALIYGLQWSSLSNGGTITYLPGDRGAASITGLGWFNVEDYGAVHDGITDDTTAIQDTIDACNSAGGGVVYFPRGVYIVGGALQDGSRGNAQLLLPSIDTTGEQTSITLLGETLPGLVPSLTGTITTPHATTLKSTLNSGAGGALLGGWGPVGSFQDFTLVNLRIENLAFQMPDNPVLSALNLTHIEAIDLVNVVTHTGNYQVDSLTQPTTATSYGVRTPMNANGASTRLDSVLSLGFYNGFEINEHTEANNLVAAGCYRAAVFPTNSHSSIITRVMINWCTYGVVVTGVNHFIISELNVEHHATTGAWFDPVYDVDDASNLGVGSIVYHCVISGTGADDPILINGATGIHIISIHDAGGSTVITSSVTVLMNPGVTPPDPILTPDGYDWIYA